MKEILTRSSTKAARIGGIPAKNTNKKYRYLSKRLKLSK